MGRLTPSSLSDKQNDFHTVDDEDKDAAALEVHQKW